MCGRYALFMPPEELKARLGLENILNIPPRYNCAPMQNLPIVIKNRMGLGRWGLRAPWLERDDPAMAVKMINARSETVAEKASYKESWAKGRRCIIPVSGFYEWARPEGGPKQPYFIRGEDDFLCMAGIWSVHEGQVSFSVLTRAADGSVADIHHRAPVCIAPQDAPAWFGGNAEAAMAMIKEASSAQFSFYPVSTDVGKVANDGAYLVEEVPPVQKQQGSLL